DYGRAIDLGTTEQIQKQQNKQEQGDSRHDGPGTDLLDQIITRGCPGRVRGVLTGFNGCWFGHQTLLRDRLLSNPYAPRATRVSRSNSWHGSMAPTLPPPRRAGSATRSSPTTSRPAVSRFR